MQMVAFMGALVSGGPFETFAPPPLSTAEKECAYTEANADGVRLWGAITGYKCSSTRTEVAGGVIAALADGPVHQGSDSSTYVEKASR